MHWLNKPTHWQARDDALFVTADPGTDFWRTTHYGVLSPNPRKFREARFRLFLVQTFRNGCEKRKVFDGNHDQIGAEEVQIRLPKAS